MKTIKQFDTFHPQQQLKQFFRQIPLGQTIIIAGTIIWALLKIGANIYANQSEEKQSEKLINDYGTISFLAILYFSDFLIFILFALSDYKKYQEKRGTLTFLFSILIRSYLILLVHYLIEKYLFLSYPQLNGWTSKTSIPLQVLIMITLTQTIQNPQEISYIFIKPFQIKSKFKLIFYVILLQIISLRVDLLVALSIQFMLVLFKLDKKLFYLSRKIQTLQKIPKILIKIGYLKTPIPQSQLKQLDIIKTNSSIVMEEK